MIPVTRGRPTDTCPIAVDRGALDLLSIVLDTLDQLDDLPDTVDGEVPQIVHWRRNGRDRTVWEERKAYVFYFLFL